MAKLLFANNAATTLAGPLSNTATTINLAAGGGALFPAPTGTQYFKLTLIDSNTGLLNEIVHVTARSGDVLTVIRGQEGTTALTWNTGDLAQNLVTAGTLAAMAQSDGLASSFYQGVAGGTANALTVDATVPDNQAPQNGQIFVVTKNTLDNTDAVTLKIPTTGGVTRSVVFADGSGLAAKDWPANSAALIYCTGGVYVFMGVLTRLNFPGLPAADETPAATDILAYYDMTEQKHVKRDLLSFALALSAIAPSISPPHQIYSKKTAGTDTFTVPANTYWVFVTVVGAGAGGAGGNGSGAANTGGGGGAGGSAFGWVAVTPGQQIPVVVGAGGIGSSSTNSQGANGGASSAAGLSATGGTGGSNNPSAQAGGIGGTGSGGQIQQFGGAGGDGSATVNVPAGNGGTSSQGGGGRTSTLGHGNAAAADGRASGSGGGGIWGTGAAYQTGGYGADGCVYILF